MVSEHLMYYATGFCFPRHKNTDDANSITGKIHLYWITPTFDKEPLNVHNNRHYLNTPIFQQAQS